MHGAKNGRPHCYKWNSSECSYLIFGAVIHRIITIVGQQVLRHLSVESTSQMNSSSMTHTCSTTCAQPGFVSTVPALSRPVHQAAQHSHPETTMMNRLNVPHTSTIKLDQESPWNAAHQQQGRPQDPVNVAAQNLSTKTAMANRFQVPQASCLQTEQPPTHSHISHSPQTSSQTSVHREASPMKPQNQGQETAHSHWQSPAHAASTVKDIFEMSDSSTLILQPPGSNATTDDKVDFLHQQLDSFRGDKPVVGDLMSLGCSGSERRQGGVVKAL